MTSTHAGCSRGRDILHSDHFDQARCQNIGVPLCFICYIGPATLFCLVCPDKNVLRSEDHDVVESTDWYLDSRAVAWHTQLVGNLPGGDWCIAVRHSVTMLRFFFSLTLILPHTMIWSERVG
eukprot:SAG11_NODE_1336_length_5173_cov_10.716791_7_plen_122_part_00